MSKSSYDRYMDFILDYYSAFYRHYRRCQRTAHVDATRYPDGSIIYTRQAFLDELDIFVSEWNASEGKIRLLLPSSVLEIHENAVECFNVFHELVKSQPDDIVTEEYRLKRVDAFKNIESVKIDLEIRLREFLRTERLLK
ncbi:hypothetical protein D3C86_1696990 [compost metagenome]